MRKAISAIFVLLAIGAIVFIILDILNVNKCRNCGEAIIGKPERIDEVIVCERCYNMNEEAKIAKPL